MLHKQLNVIVMNLLICQNVPIHSAIGSSMPVHMEGIRSNQD